jgi:hypothetical protein
MPYAVITGKSATQTPIDRISNPHRNPAQKQVETRKDIQIGPKEDDLFQQNQ